VRLPGTLLAAALAAASAIAHAQGTAPDANRGRNLAASCANCHGTAGKTAAGSPVAALAGRPKDEIVRLMNEFRDGKRPSTIMHQFAKGYTPDQIDLVAAWFAAQK
jgi:cytochrome c553